MNVYFYDLKLNETYYMQYLAKGFEQNGHTVIYHPVIEDTKTKNKRFPTVQETINIINKNDIDLIVFLGFGFLNHTSTQTKDPVFIPDATKTPYVVMFYDDPRRHLETLAFCHTKYDIPHKFFCCDSQLAETMNKFIPFDYSPCTFDPDIQFRRGINPNYNCGLSFAGSVFNKKTLLERRRGLNMADIELLETTFNGRTPGVYFDYMAVVLAQKMLQNKQGLIQSFLMEQKHALRMDLFETLSPHQISLYGQGDFNPKTEAPNVIQYNRNLHQHFELPFLYSSSDINFTIELLPSSVHQRIFECFASGGFMLCESKKDMFLNFPADLVQRITWGSLEELSDKTDYYLSNPIEKEKCIDEMAEILNKTHFAKIRVSEVLNKCKNIFQTTIHSQRP